MTSAPTRPRRLDRFFRPDAFEITVLMIALFRGVFFLTGFVPSPAAEQLLPLWLRVACLAELTLGALICLVGRVGESFPRWRQSVQWEYRGLFLLGPSALAYMLVLAVENAHKSATFIVVYTMTAWACAARAYTIRRRTKYIAQVAELGA